MNYELLFPSDYVKAADIEGRDVTVEIAGVGVEALQLRGTSKKKKKGIIEFKGKEKRFVLGRTNGDIIAGMYGTDTDSWIGKRITLFATDVEANGKPIRNPSTNQQTIAIRVRPQVPK